MPLGVLIRKGYLTEGHTLEELAHKAGINPAAQSPFLRAQAQARDG